jgi:hypothetical protein
MRSSLLIGVVALAVGVAVGCTSGATDDGDGDSDGVGSAQSQGGPDTIAGFHYMAGTNVSNADVFGAHRGWALEVVQGDEGWQFDPITRSRELGYRVLARVDHGGGNSIPARDADLERYLNRVDTAIARGAVGVVVGNEPNLEDECRDDPAGCDPARYAAVFDAVKARVGARALVLVAGLSPGRPNTAAWWKAMASKLRACPDAFAIHAYAGVDTGGWPTDTWVDRSVALYEGQADGQVALIDQTRCAGKPIYVTEFNTQPLSDLQSKMSEQDAKNVMGAIAAGVLAYENGRGRGARTKAILWFVGENRNGSWNQLAAFEPGGERRNAPVVQAVSDFGRNNGRAL